MHVDLVPDILAFFNLEGLLVFEECCSRLVDLDGAGVVWASAFADLVRCQHVVKTIHEDIQLLAGTRWQS